MKEQAEYDYKEDTAILPRVARNITPTSLQSAYYQDATYPGKKGNKQAVGY